MTDAQRLAPYVPRLSVEWLRAPETGPYQTIEGTLAFVDVSGFTALTERLASRGKVGAEEVSDVIGAVFSELLDIGYEYGCELLKWGGDAALVLFREPGSAARGTRAAFFMSAAMSRIGQVRTSLGRVQLGIAIGLHRGAFDLYLLGAGHKELIITGPAATVTARMEAIAEAGEVVVSSATAELLDSGCLGPAKGEGRLVWSAPAAPPEPNRTAVDVTGADVATLLPPPTRQHLLGGGESAEHRHAAVAFVEFSGVGDLRAAGGPAAVSAALEPIVTAAGDAANRRGVTFHGTDIGPDGGKLLLLGGIPVVRGNDEDRVVRAVHDIVDAGAGPLRLRAGINAGRVFMHETGPPFRRIHSFSGDAVNLAARIMGRAAPGQVLATAAVLDRSASAYVTTALEPFTVKGKTEPVVAYEVGAVVSSRPEAVDGGLPFVGRETEMAVLDRALAGAAQGTGAVVDVVAEPGMGKSRLVAEVTAKSGLATFRVACEEHGSAAPYSPFRQLVFDIVGLPDNIGFEEAGRRLAATVAERAPELTVWLPLLGDVFDVPTDETPEVAQIDPRYRKNRAQETATAFFTRLLDTPTTLVFEDIHEIDDASAELLGRLAALCASRPWLLVVTRRPGPDPFPAELDGLVGLPLAPLAGDAAAALVGLAGGDLVLRSSDRDLLVARAAGNPLFLRELLVAFGDAGSVEALPDTIEPLLAAQVDRLAPADRLVLRAAAVLGVHFDTDLLSVLLDQPGALDDALWGRISEFVVPGEGTDRRFTHALMRDAAYEGLSFRRRRDLHGRAAEAIEARTTDPLDQAEIMSLHFSAAERWEPAWRYSRMAGDWAASLYANADAAGFYRRALDAARHLRSVPAPEVAAVAEALGDASELAGDYEVARTGYAEARRRLPGPVERARLLRKTGVIHERHGRYREALRCYTRGRALVGEEEGAAGAERSELAIAYAGVRYRQGRYRDCLGWAETAAQEATTAWHRPGLAHALYLQDLALSDMAVAASDQANQALAIYEELGDLVGQGNVLNNLGVSAYYLGQWADALDYYRASAAARQRAGDVTGAATEENNIAEILSDQGHFDEARRLLESARATWRSADYPVGVALALSNLGRLAARSGEFDEASQLLTESLERFSAIGASAYVAETEIRQAEAELWAGRPEDAVRASSGLLSRIASFDGAEILGLSVRRIAGIGRALAGDPAGGRRELDEAVRRAEAVRADYELAQSLAARAVVAWGVDRWLGTSEAGPRADAEAASELFDRLGVERAVVTSCDEPWPDGALATHLSGRRLDRVPSG